MPTYAYACTACTHRFDIVQAFTEDSLTVCPECDGRLRKQFNSVGVVFKGSGFYRNDSRATKNGESLKADSPVAAATPDSGSTAPVAAAADKAPSTATKKVPAASTASA